VISKIFVQYNYEHIWTPAVEPVDILKRGGDIVDKQVYGLYGLAQGAEDTKDYALHFDLTIPLARYVLDHRNELSFPFKRYQMQPVWRGERTKRGRYKEFRQFDVDVVRPSETKIGNRYDAETVMVLDRAMQAVCDSFSLDIKRVLKISHIGLTKSRLTQLGCDDDMMQKVLRIMDDYYKFERSDFEQKMKEILGSDIANKIFAVIDSRSIETLS
jgi:histidyl-tRNA synthetase